MVPFLGHPVQSKIRIQNNHGLYGSNKLLYKRWALSIGEGKFRPPQLRNLFYWRQRLYNTAVFTSARRPGLYQDRSSTTARDEVEGWCRPRCR